jgi:tetratricopeptide (TPR) repeat protein
LASETPDDGSAPPVVVQPEAGEDLAILQEARRLYETGDAHGYLAALERFMSTPTYRGMPTEQRTALRGVYLGSLAGTGRATEAYKELKSLTDSGADATGALWLYRTQAALVLKDHLDAMKSFTVLLQKWPLLASSVNDEFVFEAFRQEGDATAARSERIRGLLALYDSKWTPHDPFTVLDGQRLELVRGLMEQNQVGKAREVAATISYPNTIASMRMARRFDAVIPTAQSQADLADLADRYIQTLRDKVRETPERLSGANALASSLYDRAKLTEALAVVDDAIARATPADGGKSPFSDMDQLIWTYNRKADILLYLGRGEEAIAAMKSGAARLELGANNVSQQLNLGQFYMLMGRPEEALTATDQVGEGNVSGYGRMDREGIRAQAYLQLHDMAKYRASLSYMTAHAEDAPFWLFDVLLASGDDDAAARQLIKLMKDPARQAGALDELQDYVAPETTPEPIKMRAARLKALRERADVKAAVASAGGRILSLPFRVNF